MDIVIKSFNRPYYLDRCIYSIYTNVLNFDGKIFVLDDGTPQDYLKKIIDKYPNIIIRKSKFYDKKSNEIINGVHSKEYRIPTDLWLNVANEVSYYFLLIEDDTWFIKSVELQSIKNEMEQNNVVITKLFWLGNTNLKQHKEITKTRYLELLTPNLFTFNPAIYNFIFRKNYFNWHRRILAKLKIYTFKKHMAYYSIYSVAGTILRKDFYIELWSNNSNKVEETLQIMNALKFYKKNNGKINFACYKKEILRTGFHSSATNQHKEHYEGQVDMFYFNKIINNEWLTDKLNVYKDLPFDIDANELAEILDKKSNINSKNWISWVENFKRQYTSIGCIIE